MSTKLILKLLTNAKRNYRTLDSVFILDYNQGKERSNEWITPNVMNA